MKSHKKIVLSVMGFPQISETFIVDKFIGMLERGWDAHVVCDKRLRKNEKYFPALAGNSRARVHQTLPASGLAAVLLLPFALGRAAFFRPKSLYRYLVSGFASHGLKTFAHFYLDYTYFKLGPELIHFEFGTLAAQRIRLKHQLKTTVAVSFRGFDINYSGLETPHYYRMVWKNADWVHCLGKDLWQRAQQRGCPADKPVSIIPPSVDVNFFRPLPMPRPFPEGSLRIVSVGRLTWVKGYEFALQALSLLKEKQTPFHYLILGDGPYFECIHFAGRQLDLTNQVELVGAVSRKEIKEKLQTANLFLHTAVSEGFSNAVIEAQAMGLPVITSDAGGLPENVADGTTGFVVPRRSPQALCDKLHYCFTNPEILERMGAAGRERVLQHYSTGKQVDAFSSKYRQLLDC